MSERAQKILAWLLEQETKELPIRQQTLAELFNCSRRTIGRALKELKEAGLLADLNKRHDNRCKVYQITTPKKTGMTPQGARQLELYRPTFEIVFREWPDWGKYYSQVTWELANETDIHMLWRQTFDKLYVIRDAQQAHL